MYSQDSFEKLLAFGNAAETIELDYCNLDILQIDPEEWSAIGILQKKRISGMIRCSGCDSSIPVLARTTDGGIRLVGDCPECGRYDLLPQEMFLWQINFIPVFEAAQKALRCSGSIQEIIPGSLWSLGRAPVAGQSCEIFACAGINSSRNKHIIEMLPEGKTPVLLVLGDEPIADKLKKISPDRVFIFAQLTHIEHGSIVFDATHIQNKSAVDNRKTTENKPAGRNSKIGDVIIKMKTELRQFMCGIYSDMIQAERSGRDYNFCGIKQKDLADSLGITPVIVNRALKKDMELKALFDAANNPRTAYSYGKKAMA